MLKREIMERVLVRYGGQRVETVQTYDDQTIQTLAAHLKCRLTVPDSRTDLQPVSLDDVLLATG